jgi:hypothetical protein
VPQLKNINSVQHITLAERRTKNTGKPFDKTQHHLLIKTFKKLGVSGDFFNTIKAIYEKATNKYAIVKV